MISSSFFKIVPAILRLQSVVAAGLLFLGGGEGD